MDYTFVATLLKRHRLNLSLRYCIFLMKLVYTRVITAFNDIPLLIGKSLIDTAVVR